MDSACFEITNKRRECVVSFSRVKIAINIYKGIRALLEGRNDPENEAMRMGTAWEPIARYLLQQHCPHWQLIRACFTWLPHQPRLFGGTCDFWMPWHWPRPAVVEIKCTYYQTSYDVGQWSAIPAHYIPQLECEMRGVGYDLAYLVVLAREQPMANTAQEARELYARISRQESRVFPAGHSLLAVWEYHRNDKLWDEFIYPRLQIFKELQETKQPLRRHHMSTLDRSLHEFERIRKLGPECRRILLLDLYDPTTACSVSVEEPEEDGWLVGLTAGVPFPVAPEPAEYDLPDNCTTNG